MKRFLVWLLTDALSVNVGRFHYVPDWGAIGAMASSGAVVIGLAAIWYSIRILRVQLRHQTELEAKHLEQELLLRVMDLAEAPYEATKLFVADIASWRLSGGPSKNPEFFFAAGKTLTEGHRRLHTATSAALHVLRRSRPRRFPRGTTDHAFERYYQLIQKVLESNARLLQYTSRDISQLDVMGFQKEVGFDAFQMADLLRRFTGELLARMYSDDPEWESIEYKQVGEPSADGTIPFDFADRQPIGRR